VLVVAAAGSGAASATHAGRSPAQVVRAWSAALNANRNEDAANLFAPNAEIIEGTAVGRLTSHSEAVAFNASLPCAGRIVAMQLKPNAVVVATFVLGHRPKHTCDGPGQKAAALFIIRGGKIAVWERVAVPAKKKPKGPTA
jgi:limonene-1,2-epoxide hydrolase